ncbi:MAG: hypothetical protein IT215_00540 [Chitinophagaceae bacterium]|nr:hypothetical protein [Chitinophagaceae bacterium]
MKAKKFIVMMAIAIFTLQSCMTTKTSIGSYREDEGNRYTYSRSKQVWLFWGLLPVGRTYTNTPGDGNCQVVTRFNFTDVLISALTGGIVMSQNIKVKAKKN